MKEIYSKTKATLILGGMVMIMLGFGLCSDGNSEPLDYTLYQGMKALHSTGRVYGWDKEKYYPKVKIHYNTTRTIDQMERPKEAEFRFDTLDMGATIQQPYVPQYQQVEPTYYNNRRNRRGGY